MSFPLGLPGVPGKDAADVAPMIEEVPTWYASFCSFLSRIHNRFVAFTVLQDNKETQVKNINCLSASLNNETMIP